MPRECCKSGTVCRLKCLPEAVFPLSSKTAGVGHLELAVLFYRAALNAGRSSQEKAVRLSVKRVNCDKTEDRSVQIFYTIRKI